MNSRRSSLQPHKLNYICFIHDNAEQSLIVKFETFEQSRLTVFLVVNCLFIFTR